ncbi:MAG: DUF4158 domain-containing protein [Flavobacteriales bacterium]|nr:DUF4158 domain-containing protein [Flavobacteriales bacterium]
MQILNTTEEEQYDNPPIFDATQRKKSLTFSQSLLEIACELRTPDNQVGFLVACGYFKVTKKFFSSESFHLKDINYVSRQLNLGESYNYGSYSNRTRQRHEHLILEYFGIKRFDKDAEILLSQEAIKMVHDQLKPNLIFWRCVDFLNQQKIELPSSNFLTLLITDVLAEYKENLMQIINESLDYETKYLLDELFTQESTSKTSRYRLTLLKRISQSTKPAKVRERVLDVAYLAQLHDQLIPVISAMGLKHEGIKYYAGSVHKSKIFQLHQRSDEDRYIHTIAFIAHQYFRLQDNLIDVLLSVVRTFQNTVQREHKELCYEQGKSHNLKLSSFLDRLDDDVFDLIKQIRELSDDESMSDTHKISEIRLLLQVDNCNELENEKLEIENEMNAVELYKILEARSVRLQNRVSPILKTLDFQAESGAADLMDAIRYFKLNNGVIKINAPLKFLNDDQEAAVVINHKINPSLYKVFLFIHITSAIKAGTLNLNHSYKYRPLDDYIISKERWGKEKQQLIERQVSLSLLIVKLYCRNSTMYFMISTKELMKI